jgi:hypothetical protein
MSSEEIKIGDTLYRPPYKHNRLIEKFTVTSIGRKYFYCNYQKETPFDKTTLAFEDKTYSQFNFRLYRSEQEILDERDANEIYDKLRKAFSYYRNPNYSLEELKHIQSFLNIL